MTEKPDKYIKEAEEFIDSCENLGGYEREAIRSFATYLDLELKKRDGDDKR